MTTERGRPFCPDRTREPAADEVSPVERPGFLHIYRYDKKAVRVPPEGNLRGEPLQHGDWSCVMCTARASFCARFNADHGDDCPGHVTRVHDRTGLSADEAVPD